MTDYAHNYTDRMLSELGNTLVNVYRQASYEMADKVADYFDSFEERDEEQQAALKSGQITQTEYNQWRTTQLGRGERYEALRDELAHRYTNANNTAMLYVYDNTPSVYSLNRNYSAYTIEKSGADVAFNLWDEATVRRLAVLSPDLMPSYPKAKAVNRGIDLEYGKQQISASILSGILQGKTLKQLAQDLMNRLTNMNLASALRTARTAFTSAENGGRYDAYTNAEEQGIKLEKQWLSTLDSRTRDAHKQADEQTVKNDEYFTVGGEKLKFPGDATFASGWNLYNCRCTMIAVLPDIDADKAERWSRDPETGEPELISDMTYDEWAKEKGIEGKTVENELKNGDNKDYKINEQKYRELLEESTKKLARSMSEKDYQAYLDLLMNCGNGDILKLYEKYADAISGIKFVEDETSRYSLLNNDIWYRYDKEDYDGLTKYSTLAHEYGHFFDFMANYSDLTYNEFTALVHNNVKAIGVSCASNSDEFLTAVREDREILTKAKNNVHDVLDFYEKDASGGVQDAIQGLTGTRLPWGHEQGYYENVYNKNVNKNGTATSLKKAYKEMGYKLDEEGVKMESRVYTSASEMWANITEAEIDGGEELEYVKKYMPNSVKAYESIIGRQK